MLRMTANSINEFHVDQRKVRSLFVGKRKLKARPRTYEHRMIVIPARRPRPPFSTRVHIHCLPWFKVTFLCIRQRRRPFWVTTFHCVADRALMINVLSKKLRRKTKSFDLVMPFKFDKSTQINVTKLSMQLLNFRGRIFAQLECGCAFSR